MLYVFFWVIPRRRGITQKKTYNISEPFIAPTNAQHIYIKTLKFFTLKYITIAATCFGFD
jgi:hypothetical protein